MSRAFGNGSAGRLQFVVNGRIPWDGVWLNRHYFSREFAKEHRVVYVLDPLPSNPWKRWRKRAHLRRESLQRERVPEGVAVRRLAEIPLQRFAAVRGVTARWRARRIRAALDPLLPTVVVYYPRAAVLPAGALDEVLTVYSCSDDYRTTPDGETDRDFCAWEDRMLARADLVVTVTEALVRKLEPLHPRVRLVENGFDPEFFHPHAGPPPADLEAIPRPRIGFVGSVRHPLIDLAMMERVARSRPSWSLVFIGWWDEEDPDARRLAALPNAHFLGKRPRETLAAYLSHMDVLTSPYPRCDLTEVALPLKAYEALGVGRPLVATHAPPINRYAPFLRSVDGEEAFVGAVEECLASPPAPDPAVVEGCTWSRRAEELLGFVREGLARS